MIVEIQRARAAWEPYQSESPAARCNCAALVSAIVVAYRRAEQRAQPAAILG
jgi:hypothetical protein